MLWAALRPSVYSMNREIIVYRKLVSKFWTVGTYSERKKSLVTVVVVFS